MSRKIPKEQYEKSFAFHFKQWLDGTKEMYVDNVEMQPAQEFKETKLEEKKRIDEKETLLKKVHDTRNNVGITWFKKFYNVFSIVFCLFLVTLLLIATSYLPSFGAKDNPVNNEVSKRYIEKGLEETGAVNAVTGMILDYRAFDTLGESHVLFIATCAVLILLRKDEKTAKRGNSGKTIDELDRTHEPKNDVVLQTTARVLVPPIIIFGIYVILTGHLGPGGGFSGGAIVGAGLILYLNAFGFKKTERFFSEKTYKILSISALGCYALCKSYSFYTGANHIHSVIPLGTPGAIISSGLILILNICVGIVVAGTMYTFYVMFRKGGY